MPNPRSATSDEIRRLVEEGNLFDLLTCNSSVVDVQALLDNYPDKVVEENEVGYLPLHIAAAFEASVEVINLLLEKNKSAAQKKDTFRGSLPLHWAIAEGCGGDVVRALLYAYPDGVKEKNDKGQLPLHIALSNKCERDVVKILLDAYPEGVTTKNYEGQLPLHLALEFKCDFDVARALLDAHPDGAKEKNDKGQLPLHLALEFKCGVDVLKILLDAYPEGVKEVDNDGHLPLSTALINDCDYDLVVYLLEEFPEAGLKATEQGHLSSQLFIDSGHLNGLLCTKPNTEEVQSMISNHPGQVEKFDRKKSLPLHTAIRTKNGIGVLRMILNAYPEGSKTTDDDGKLPLHIAAMKGSELDVVNLLLEAFPEGASASDIDGSLSIHIALTNMGCLDVVKALLGAYPDGAKTKDDYGSLPLHIAMLGKCGVDVVKALLIAYPEGAMERNNEGQLPLHYAMKQNFILDVVKALLDVYPEGAKEKGDEGNLPLHLALENRCMFEVVTALIEAYPDGVKEKNVHRRLPLHVAVSSKCELETVNALLHAHPDGAKSATNEGELALHIAIQCKCELDVVRRLLDVYHEGSRATNNERKLPLHIALEGNCDIDLVMYILDKNLEGVKAQDNHGRLPLHTSVSSKCEIDTVMRLLQKYPNGAKVKDKDERLPLDIAIENCYSEQLIFALLNADMPILIDGTHVEEHSGSWIICVRSDTNVAVRAVQRILSKEEGNFRKHIQFLASVTDAQGRSAVDVAIVDSKREINKYLYFCGRFRMDLSSPEHRTLTSILVRAEDINARQDYGTIFDNNDEDNDGKLGKEDLERIASSMGLYPESFLKGNECVSKKDFIDTCTQYLGDGPRKVVIKLIKSKEHCDRECKIRKNHRLSPKYLVSPLENIPDEEAFKDAVEAKEGGLSTIAERFLKGIDIGHHAIVMDAADRNLDQIFFQEQPKHDDVRRMLKEVFECVNHLHENKLMHDASARISSPNEKETSFTGAKFSSAILPPEMIASIEPSQIDEFEAYWETETDEGLKEKVKPKLYVKDGAVKACYVVKSFRTKKGVAIEEGLLYKLVCASEKIDAWSLGALMFIFLTGTPLIPSTRDDDCASGTAMHILKTWGDEPEVLIERFNKIEDVAARHLVMQLLKKDPNERPSIASVLENHPYFDPKNHDKDFMKLIFDDEMKQLKKKARFCGRFKLHPGAPLHCTPTSVLVLAQDLAERVDYNKIFRLADVDRDGTLDREELVASAESIGLNADLILNRKKSISKKDFIDICKQELGDGPRQVVIKFMRSREHWERERRARKNFTLDSKYVVSELPNAPSESDVARAVDGLEGGLENFVKGYLEGKKLGKHAIVMGAADRNLHQIFYQEQPKVDAVRDILRQVFVAVNHLHEKKLMHGDIKMSNIVLRLEDFKLRLIDLDASARISSPNEKETSFTGAKFSSAILPPEMIASIEPSQIDEFEAYWETKTDEVLEEKVKPKLYVEDGAVKACYVVKSFRTKKGVAIEEGLLYKLVCASEKIDAWSLGALMFIFLTGTPLIPSTRDDDCASGTAMHILKTWGDEPEVLIERFNKIEDVAARHLVMQLLKKDPNERPSIASVLENHPYFEPKNHDKVFMKSIVDDEMKQLKKKARFCGRFKLHPGAPLHRTPTSVLVLAQDLAERVDYNKIFRLADVDRDGTLDREELVASAEKIGLNADLILNRKKSISKKDFIDICKQELGDGPRQVVIKFMRSREHWERERRARKNFTLDSKYVVSELPNAPSEIDVAKAVDGLEGGLENIVNEYLERKKPGIHAIVMGAADRNLHQIFYQEQPKVDAIRDILRKVFVAVNHLHQKKLMHGDIKMSNIVRFSFDGILRLIDLDASTRIFELGETKTSFAGAKFSSAILPPEMIASIKAEEVDAFNDYWKLDEDVIKSQTEAPKDSSGEIVKNYESDAGLNQKVKPKEVSVDGEVKARYVVKSFRTENGNPVDTEKLPYKLVRASENIDAWSLGVLAYTLLTGEPLIPSTRDDDCASGAAMHLLYTWGEQSDILLDLLKKISNDAARDLVMHLLERKPEKRPQIHDLLSNHPFFNTATLDQVRKMDQISETLQKQAEQLVIMNENIRVVKKLSYEGMSQLRLTRHVLSKAIYEATTVKTPFTFIILLDKLPEPPQEENVSEEKMLKFVVKEDGEGVCAKTKHFSVDMSSDGATFQLQGDVKKAYDQVQVGIMWAKRIKDACTNLRGGNVDEVFALVKTALGDLPKRKMYLYLVDQLTGKPVRAPDWPIEIKTQSDHVHKLLPAMTNGMQAMSILNGASGLVRMFGFPFPKVPDAWVESAQESIDLLKKGSSVAAFDVVNKEVKEAEGGKEKETTLGGASLRAFEDFLKKYDPGLKKDNAGDFAGLQRIGDPEDGTAIWTKLTKKEDIERALEERRKQSELEKEKEVLKKQFQPKAQAREEENLEEDIQRKDKEHSQRKIVLGSDEEADEVKVETELASSVNESKTTSTKRSMNEENELEALNTFATEATASTAAYVLAKEKYGEADGASADEPSSTGADSERKQDEKDKPVETTLGLTPEKLHNLKLSGNALVTSDDIAKLIKAAEEATASAQKATEAMKEAAAANDSCTVRCTIM